MLNFATARIFFGLCAALTIILHIFQHISLSWLLLPTIIFISAISYGSYFIQSNFFVKAVCSSSTVEQHIAITFDDGPDLNITPKILDILKENKIQAGFFCIGHKILGNENILQRISEEGHVIGNHSYSHSNFFDFYPTDRIKNELIKTEELIKQSVGKKVNLFRPPFGVTTPAISSAVKELDYTVVGWNVRSMDTVTRNSEEIFQRVIKKLKPGAVILFHDTRQTSVEVLKKLVAYTKQNGITIVSPDKLLNLKAYED